ncbi:hypothetical protein VTO42DRAFT_7123 [Malbranchea cinnamomea]
MVRSTGLGAFCSLLLFSSLAFALADPAVDSNIHDRRYEVVKRQQGSGIPPNSIPTLTLIPADSSSSAPVETSSSVADPTTSDEEPTVSSDPPVPSSTPDDSTTPMPPVTTPTGNTPLPTPTSSRTTFQTTTADSTSEEEPGTTQPPETTADDETTLSSSTVTRTTTNDDGTVQTYTSVVVVHPTRTGDSDESSTVEPTLQNSAPTVGMKKEVFAVLGGAVVAAMAL